MTICIVEAVFCYQAFIQSPMQNPAQLSCYLGLPYIFHGMAFWAGSGAAAWNKVYKDMLWWSEALCLYSMLVMLFLNMCLCHDLVQILKSPFSVARVRLNVYYSISFLVPFIIIWYILANSQQRCPTTLIHQFMKTDFKVSPLLQGLECHDPPYLDQPHLLSAS